MNALPPTTKAHPIYGWLTESEYKAMMKAPYGYAAGYKKLSDKRAKEASKTRKSK